MRSLAVLSAFILTCPILVALAQVPPPAVKLEPPSGVKGDTKKDGQSQAKDSKSKGDPDEPDGPKESPRMQKLKTLRFDRRPSAILKAWSQGPEQLKKDPKSDATKKEEKPDPIDLEMTALQFGVTLGDWKAVKKYWSTIPLDEAKAGYKRLLQALPGAPTSSEDGPSPEMSRGVMQFMEKNRFVAEDIVGIAAAAPEKLEKQDISLLARIVQQAIAGGTVVEHLVVRLKEETDKPKDQAALTPRQAASLLLTAGQGAEVAVFLPPLEKALASDDHEALNLLASHFLASHAKEKKGVLLEKAWTAAQAVLTNPTADMTEKEEAIKRAVELAAKIREELGQTWLEQSFTKEPQRGMSILATLGTSAAQGIQRQSRDKDGRLKMLQLQKTAVDALLKAAPENAAKWQSTLTLLAANWLKEAEFSHQHDRSTTFGPNMRRDPYGNLFFLDDEDMPDPRYMQRGDPDMPVAITVANVLLTRPADNWIGQIDDGLRPKLRMMYAQLYLKVNEETKAFPYIEQLSAAHPDKARALIKDFLKVWAKNHNPNANKDYTNPYMFMYGYERRSESIPLTRSKQERNLIDLAEWVVKLRKLNLGDLDEEMLAKAFTSCHSSAEVYRMEAIEKVFGKIEDLKPRTLAGLSQQMRENLAGLWRQPAEQKDKKTNRKTKDIQSEVLRGYSVAQGVIDNGLKKFNDHWALLAAKAALLHDENSYRQELSKSSEFSKRRADALALFAKAANQYAAQVKTMAEEDETTQVFEQWLYASLGACDLRSITEEMVPDVKQAALLRASLKSLPGETAERHLKKFANLLFTRLSAVKPAVKFTYLRSGLEIVGDHPLATEARKIYDYYKDLITEIKLDVSTDGSDVIGHKQPFGVFVNLKHTREIERESGGFGKYLQNQNTMYFSYNYGRPLADYRDRFTQVINEALKEHFDVLSVTFQTDKVNSRALPEYGWRYTPYAYLLLKARGPQVDKIPPLRIDLDFLDTSGYVIIPIESAAVPIDASPAKPGARPYGKLQITQTLDERQADKGKLILEIKAAALGLIPDFDQIATFSSPGLEVENINDNGVSVARFDPDSEQNAIVSERSWLIQLKATPGQASSPESFRFAKAKVDNAEMTFQRYKDADLMTVTSEVPLDQQYGERSHAWLWWTIAGVATALVSLTLLIIWLRKRAPRTKPHFRLADNLSPIAVMTLLKNIGLNESLNDSQQKELQQSLGTLERHYFAQDGNGEIDLREIAETWLRKTEGEIAISRTQPSGAKMKS